MIQFNRKIIFVFVYLQVLFYGGGWAKFIPSYELRQSASTTENICLTPGCVKAAAQILNNIDENINPCEDFYQFACGGWQDRHIIPDDKSSVSVMGQSQEHLDIQLRVLLDKPLADDDPDFVKLLKTMFNSCMDTKRIETLKEKPLKPYMDKVGGWPVVLGDKWDESKFNWIETLTKIFEMGFAYTSLFTIYVEVDFKDNTKYTIMLDEPFLGIPDRSYYLEGLNNSATSSYLNYMIKVATHFGVDKNVAEEELIKSFEFETKLANITWPSEERRNFTKLYNLFSIKQLKEMAPQVDWLKIINGLISTEITEDEMIMVTEPDFIKKFANIIASTDKRTVANYIVWRMVQESVSQLSKDWRALSQEYAEALLGRSQEPSRWEICLSPLKEELAVALGAYYVRNYFKEESKQAATKMFEYILKEFLNILNTVDWMENGTRTKAIEKANSLAQHIGYPNELRNDTAISDYFAGVDLNEDSYFSNRRKLNKFVSDKSFRQLRKRNTKGKWNEFASEVPNVNAYNNILDNSIVLPAGILKDVYFGIDRPNYLNFGGIGYVIGHEITHGFDDTGRQFDKDGNNKNWWDPETDKCFNEKVKCIIDQYNNYTVDEVGLNVNGYNTQGENVADNGGVTESYKAYKAWVADNGAELSLPGLKYTPSQLFWISVANVWCSKFRNEALKLNILTEVHSPEKYRIIGSLSNSNEFAQDFNCPVGSKMNPANKCRVW